MRLCKDCKHFRAPMGALSTEGYATCHHPRWVSVVTGEIAPRNCQVQRDGTLENYCGMKAQFFEAADGTPELAP